MQKRFGTCSRLHFVHSFKFVRLQSNIAQIIPPISDLPDFGRTILSNSAFLTNSAVVQENTLAKRRMERRHPENMSAHSSTSRSLHDDDRGHHTTDPRLHVSIHPELVSTEPQLWVHMKMLVSSVRAQGQACSLGLFTITAESGPVHSSHRALFAVSLVLRSTSDSFMAPVLWDQ